VAHSLLLVPVPELETAVPGAHVTLLGPFADRPLLTGELLAGLAAFFSAVAPVDATFAELRTFPDGTRYAAPEPEAPFRALTAALAARHPEHPPYGGAYDDVVPHLSVWDATPALPVRSHATEARLAWADGALTTLARFPFAVG
jgi:hypothetical protein